MSSHIDNYEKHMTTRNKKADPRHHVMSEEDLIKLIEFNLNAWVEEEMEINDYPNAPTKEQRWSDTLTTFMERLHNQLGLDY
jgi:hypothetical protein